jgi:hypothetical protein
LDIRISRIGYLDILGGGGKVGRRLFNFKDDAAAELVDRVAQELGLTKQGDAKLTVATELELSTEAAPSRDRFER